MGMSWNTQLSSPNRVGTQRAASTNTTAILTESRRGRELESKNWENHKIFSLLSVSPLKVIVWATNATYSRREYNHVDNKPDSRSFPNIE